MLRNLSGYQYTLVDVKTLDAICATHVNSHHTDEVRLGAHVAEAKRCRRHDYKLADDGSGLPAGMRLVVFVVSTGGSLGTEAQALLAEVGKRVGKALPAALLPASSWAACRFAPFARQAVGFAVRQGLAASCRRHWRRVPAQPPPPPLLPSPPPPQPPPHPPPPLLGVGRPPADAVRPLAVAAGPGDAVAAPGAP